MKQVQMVLCHSATAHMAVKEYDAEDAIGTN